MLTEDVIGSIAERAKRNNPAMPEDYIASDGLLHCGKCGEQKECAIDVGGKEIIVRCLCRCGAEARKQTAEDAFRRLNEERRADWLRGYEGMTFDNSTGNPSMFFAEKFIHRWTDILENGLSFTLSGAVGCGKTYAAASIANELLDRGYRVWMVSTINLLDRMFDEADIIRNRLSTFELVVLDDFGAERNTEYAAEKMFQIIDDRMRSRLPTIITTNIDITQPTDNLTYQRIFSRLNGEAPQFRCKGGDLRADRGIEKRQLANEILKGDD